MSAEPRMPRRWDRREFLAIGAGAFVMAALPLAARRPQVVRRTVPVMGTFADFTVVHRDQRRSAAAIDAAVDELLRVERTMSRFRADSDIGRANAEAARDGVAIGDPTAAVLESALGWAQRTEGRFDPALGSVVELWSVTERHAPPAAAATRPLAGRGFWRAVDLDRRPGVATVRFTDRDVRLDLGGIAKGHAVDRAAAALRARGIRDAIINVGGDLMALGTAPDGDPWTVGIRSPRDPDALVGTLRVTDRAVATSGDYAQGYVWRGRRYHHLMDPGTASPRRAALHSVTVAADRCIDADAAATAVFGLTGAAAAALVRDVAGTEVVHSLG